MKTLSVAFAEDLDQDSRNGDAIFSLARSRGTAFEPSLDSFYPMT